MKPKPSPRRPRKALVAWSISLAMAALLVVALRPEDIARVMAVRPAPAFLLLFLLAAVGVALLHAWRWRLLLGGRIGPVSALSASILGLGGNMFLPARGGDLLRVHYSHVAAGMRPADVLGRLVVEKVVELAAIACIGLAAATAAFDGRDPGAAKLVVGALAVFGACLGSILALRRFSSELARAAAGAAGAFGKTGFLAPHLARTIHRAAQGLTLRRVAWPAALTLLMWLSGYAVTYLLAARMMGVPLTYTESLLVLAAGTLGLMVPGAPSGIGTYHAAIVSAFVLLHRTVAEGLLVATAVHLMYFVAYATPAALLYARWHLRPRASLTP